VLDLLIRDARIRTVDSERRAAAAIGIWHGKIVGLDSEVIGLPARSAVSAKGAVITPGGRVSHDRTGLLAGLRPVTGVPAATGDAAAAGYGPAAKPSAAARSGYA